MSVERIQSVGHEPDVHLPVKRKGNEFQTKIELLRRISSLHTFIEWLETDKAEVVQRLYRCIDSLRDANHNYSVPIPDIFVPEEVTEASRLSNLHKKCQLLHQLLMDARAEIRDLKEDIQGLNAEVKFSQDEKLRDVRLPKVQGANAIPRVLFFGAIKLEIEPFQITMGSATPRLPSLRECHYAIKQLLGVICSARQDVENQRTMVIASGPHTGISSHSGRRFFRTDDA